MSSKYQNSLAAALAAAVVAGAFLSLPVEAQSRVANSAISKPKTAAEAFKNIQVLNNIPADQLIPAMQFAASALGVECSFCHVEGAFDKDEKQPKGIARKMMKMMFAINQENFQGHREVTCYSCHRGSPHPATTPAIANELMDASTEDHGHAASNTPAPDQILDKYVNALGGAMPIERISTLVEEGRIDLGGRQFPIEILSKAPAKRISIVHLPAGDSVTGFDGSSGWRSMPGRPVQETPGSELLAARLDADLQLPLHIAQTFDKLTPEGREKVNGRDSNVISCLKQAEPPVELYFDEQSGLLTRSVRYTESPLGRNPTQIDYDDYRDQSGVRIPFRWTIARPGARFTIQIEQVQVNVAIDDSRFAKPSE